MDVFCQQPSLGEDAFNPPGEHVPKTYLHLHQGAGGPAHIADAQMRGSEFGNRSRIKPCERQLCHLESTIRSDKES